MAFHRSTLLSHTAEERVQKVVVVQFFLLAPYVAAEAIHKLVMAEDPATSWFGIGLTGSSLIRMPFLGIAKQRLADKLGSVATRGEGMQNLLCAYLAGAGLVALLGNSLFGLVARSRGGARDRGRRLREGRESWRGEGCCAGS